MSRNHILLVQLATSGDHVLYVVSELLEGGTGAIVWTTDVCHYAKRLITQQIVSGFVRRPKRE